MPIRPVAQSFTYTTSTGTFGPAYFGTGFSWLGIQMDNTSTQTAKGTVQYSLGGSDVWVDAITLTSAHRADVSLSVGTTAVFDRVRVNIASNLMSDTGTSGHTIWLGAR